MTVYTKANFNFKELNWLINPRKQLDLTAVGLGLINLPPNEGYTFTHSHQEQEEVYIVITGNGYMQIDGELVELVQGDIVRVSPSAKRALKAENDGMFVICAGAVPAGYPKNSNARYLIDDGIPDYDDIPLWYSGNTDAKERNEKLKDRMKKN
jgi:Cupin domain